MKKYPVSLFIGRFQPFHNGHLYSLRKALDLSQKVIVGIGSSQEKGTDNNPWNYEFRKKMLINLAGDLGLPIHAIEPIPDFPSDDDWARYVAELISARGYRNEDVLVIGNNEWTNSVLAKMGMTVFETGLENRDELEGTKIRKMMRKGDERWVERVPIAAVELLSRNGLI